MLPFGFHIQDDVLSKEECDRLLAALTSTPNGRAGARNLMSCDSVARLASDERLVRLASTLHGAEVIPYKATLFAKTGKSNWLVAWHQDTALPIVEYYPDHGWSAPSIKAGQLFAQAPARSLEKVIALRIHLDASTRTNGPLRVIPRSHSSGVLGDDQIKRFVNDSKFVECVVGRGGVIAMSPLILHASSKIVSDEPRRVIHIEYAESLEIEPGIMLARC